MQILKIRRSKQTLGALRNTVIFLTGRGETLGFNKSRHFPLCFAPLFTLTLILVTWFAPYLHQLFTKRFSIYISGFTKKKKKKKIRCWKYPSTCSPSSFSFFTCFRENTLKTITEIIQFPTIWILIKFSQHNLPGQFCGDALVDKSPIPCLIWSHSNLLTTGAILCFWCNLFSLNYLLLIKLNLF